MESSIGLITITLDETDEQKFAVVYSIVYVPTFDKPRFMTPLEESKLSPTGLEVNVPPGEAIVGVIVVKKFSQYEFFG